MNTRKSQTPVNSTRQHQVTEDLTEGVIFQEETPITKTLPTGDLPQRNLLHVEIIYPRQSASGKWMNTALIKIIGSNDEPKLYWLTQKMVTEFRIKKNNVMIYYGKDGKDQFSAHVVKYGKQPKLPQATIELEESNELSMDEMKMPC
jgi:hypothetical protein